MYLLLLVLVGASEPPPEQPDVANPDTPIATAISIRPFNVTERVLGILLAHREVRHDVVATAAKCDVVQRILRDVL